MLLQLYIVKVRLAFCSVTLLRVYSIILTLPWSSRYFYIPDTWYTNRTLTVSIKLCHLCVWYNLISLRYLRAVQSGDIAIITAFDLYDIPSPEFSASGLGTTIYTGIFFIDESYAPHARS